MRLRCSGAMLCHKSSEEVCWVGIEKPVHSHSYCHSMAIFLRNQGVPLDVVQLLLGHTDPRTTQLYVRLWMATARKEYDQTMSRLGRRTVDSVSLQAKSSQQGPKP
jgi:site-specific recombinase XerD